MDKKPITIF